MGGVTGGMVGLGGMSMGGSSSKLHASQLDIYNFPLGNAIHFVIYTNILYLNEMNSIPPGILQIVFYNSFRYISLSIYLKILHINEMNLIQIQTNTHQYYLLIPWGMLFISLKYKMLLYMTEWIAFPRDSTPWGSAIHSVI